MAKMIQLLVTFCDPVLGMQPGDPAIYEAYIASKAPNAKSRAEEIEEIGEGGMVEKNCTIFPKDEHDHPFVWDYQVKGMLKDSWGMLRKIKGTKCAGVKNYKKVIDGLIFPQPRKIFFIPKEGKLNIDIDMLQRPLRAQTPMGERVALAISEEIEAGTSLRIKIGVLDDALVDPIYECFDYGKVHGFGQWRNSGKGRFEYKIEKEEDCEMTDIYDSEVNS